MDIFYQTWIYSIKCGCIHSGPRASGKGWPWKTAVRADSMGCTYFCILERYLRMRQKAVALVARYYQLTERTEELSWTEEKGSREGENRGRILLCYAALCTPVTWFHTCTGFQPNKKEVVYRLQEYGVIICPKEDRKPTSWNRWGAPMKESKLYMARMQVVEAMKQGLPWH